MTAKLSATDLTLIRGENCLFKGVGFALNPGELLLLEGANGSGKTSLMRAIGGLMTPESGEILWQGQPITAERQMYHNSLAWLGHRSGLKADLTLVENLRFERALRPQSDVEFVSVLERLQLNKLKSLPVRSLSAGQQRRVALARLLLSDVAVWLLDEPFTNLDRDGRALVVSLVEEYLAKGGMCILAAHQDVEINATVRRVQL